MSQNFPESRLQELLPELIAFRRDLHAHPETAFKEYRTAERVAERLGRLPGMHVRTGVGETGIVATLAADKPGPCIALRADMDALPMEDKCGKPHASTYPGVAHACGHDGHVACLLGAAIMLASEPGRLAGPVRFLFQPGEEGGGGARFMVEQGALENPRPAAIFALHCWPFLPAGYVGMRSGPVMASTDALDITIHGKGAHAAHPNRGVDPIVAAAHVVTALQTVVSRHRDPLDPAVVTIGAFHAGTARNVIPDAAVLSGTLRALSQKQRLASLAAIRQVIEQTAAAFGARGELVHKEGYPVNVNDPGLKEYLERVAVEMLGRERVVDNIPISMGGEDFAFYTRHMPGVFWRLGVAPSDGSPGVESLHNGCFDFNDEAIETGVRVHCGIVWSWASKDSAAG